MESLHRRNRLFSLLKLFTSNTTGLALVFFLNTLFLTETGGGKSGCVPLLAEPVHNLGFYLFNQFLGSEDCIFIYFLGLLAPCTKQVRN